MPDTPQPSDAARALAARLAAGDWQLDAEPDFAAAEPPPDAAPAPGGQPQARLFPSTVAAAEPPGVEQVVEALLFAGGAPLTGEQAGRVVRGLTDERLRDAVAELNRRYRRQQRPYAIGPQAGGYVMQLRPTFREVAEKLISGPREVRLAQSALDTLSAVAYRQPVSKADIDAMRGADSGGPLRQLVRLGLVSHGRGSGYTTTRRFLELMGLDSLADLPRLGEGE